MAKKDFQEAAVSVSTQSIEVPASAFNFVFQVTNPFDRYHKGALIATDEAIQAVIDEGNALNCNRLARK